MNFARTVSWRPCHCPGCPGCTGSTGSAGRPGRPGESCDAQLTCNTETKGHGSEIKQYVDRDDTSTNPTTTTKIQKQNTSEQ